MRLMYDAVNPRNIPHDACVVAGYVGGQWPSFTGYNGIPPLHELFPHAERVSIAVNASENAMVLDVERYDASPSDAPAWVERQRKNGGYPTVYCSLSIWDQVKRAFHDQGVKHPYYWVADYDGVAEVPSGAIGKQYQNTPGYDVSIIAGHWPHKTHHATHDPAPAPAERIHYVQNGETLSGIAEHYGIDWHSLYAANRNVVGSNPDHIHAGQRLVIP